MFKLLRKFQERLFYPLSRLFVKLGVSPNAVSWLSLFTGIFGCGIIAFKDNSLGYGTTLLVISYLLDLMDGNVARLSGKTSNYGDFIECIFDRLVDSMVILALLWGNYVNAKIALSSLAVAFLISYLSSQARINFNYEVKGGFLSRAGRGFIIFIGILCYMRFPYFLYRGINCIDLALLIIIFAGPITFFGRLKNILGFAKNHNLLN